MPSIRVPPLGLGISTRRTGLGPYVPASSLVRMLSPMRPNMVAQLSRGHPVDARRALIAFNRLPGHSGVLLADHLFHQFLMHCFL